MEPASNDPKIEEFVQKNMSAAEESQRQKEYRQLLFEAKVYDLTAFSKMKLMYNVGKDVKNNTIVFFLAEHFPSEKKLVEKVLYFFISFLDEIVENKYMLVYFHNGLSCLDKQKLNFLADAFKVVPMKYFKNLLKLYTVGLPWTLKLDINIGRSFISKFLKKVIVNLPNNEDLSRQDFYQPNFCKYLPESDLELSKEIFKQQVLGKHLSDYALSDSGVPYILLAATLYFESEEQRIQIEGIFRRVSAASDQQKLISNLEIGNYEYVFGVKEPLVLSDFLKKFFVSLPDPVFPYYTYEDLLKFQNVPENEQLDFVRKVLQDVPKLNCKIVAHMMKFFKFVTRFESVNKMTARNIGICFVPCFFRRDPENKEPKVLNTLVLNSVILSHCLEIMINNGDELFPNDQETAALHKIIKKKTYIVQELKNYDEIESINKVFLKKSQKD